MLTSAFESDAVQLSNEESKSSNRVLLTRLVAATTYGKSTFGLNRQETESDTEFFFQVMLKWPPRVTARDGLRNSSACFLDCFKLQAEDLRHGSPTETVVLETAAFLVRHVCRTTPQSGHRPGSRSHAFSRVDENAPTASRGNGPGCRRDRSLSGTDQTPSC